MGTADAMAKAFGVDLKHYQVDTGPTSGNAAHVHVPDDLSGIVEAVVGFDTRPHAPPTSAGGRSQAGRNPSTRLNWPRFTISPVALTARDRSSVSSNSTSRTAANPD